MSNLYHVTCSVYGLEGTFLTTEVSKVSASGRSQAGTLAADAVRQSRGGGVLVKATSIVKLPKPLART